MTSEPSVVAIARGALAHSSFASLCCPRRRRRWDGRAMESNTVSLVSVIGVLVVKKEGPVTN